MSMPPRGSRLASNTSPTPVAPSTSNRPFNFTPAPVPNTPRSSISSASSPAHPAFEDTALRRMPPRSEPDLGQASTQRRFPGTVPTFPPATGLVFPRNVPPRPQTQPPVNRFADTLTQDMQRPQSPLRASRLVTDPLTRDGQRIPLQQQPSTFQRSSSIQSAAQAGASSSPLGSQLLIPGTLLRGGRYRLQELQGRQEWLSGVYEAIWVAQDAQRSGGQVMVCEVVLPERGSVVTQSTLRAATMALSSVGRHPHIPTLWDAFSDQGRSFFVFEPVDGESILSRMRRTGRALPEPDIVECCLQMTELLELLAQQSPPLVHGLINPEHIIMRRTGPQYILTNFSIVLAGGATQFISGIDRLRLSVYTAPEFVRGLIDVRSDLYALMATAYHGVTGSVPAGVNGSIPQAQRLNPNVSPQLDAILAKGLRSVPSQRYQRPSELRQDLLAMRSVSSTLVSQNWAVGGGQFGSEFGQRLEQPVQGFERTAQHVPDTIAEVLPNLLAPTEEPEERVVLLPRPEELPPLEERNDLQRAAIWLVAILLCLVIIVILGRGFI